jgi:hypothetical protein
MFEKYFYKEETPGEANVPFDAPGQGFFYDSLAKANWCLHCSNGIEHVSNMYRTTIPEMIDTTRSKAVIFCQNFRKWFCPEASGSIIDFLLNFPLTHSEKDCFFTI